MSRAISPKQLREKKFPRMEFDGEYEAAFGRPALTGIWIFWGKSGNGKTSAILKTCKYMTRFGKVIYNSKEEGARLSMQEASERMKMFEVSNRFLFLDNESNEEFFARLDAPKGPHVGVIDSWQYAGMTKKQYIEMKNKYAKKKLIIINSHADGKEPEGRTAKFIRFDADVKNFVEGYKIFPVSRFGGGEPLTIWDKGAADYWGE